LPIMVESFPYRPLETPKVYPVTPQTQAGFGQQPVEM
jgi:hypothetical protein